jgi:DNA-binding transcriptional regulator YdaS (Cro superfamily)
MHILLTVLHVTFRFVPMTTLARDIKKSGGASALAQKLGVSLQRLNNWRSRGRIPADMVIRYSCARDWEVTPHQLRPDIYPNPTDGLPASKEPGEAA